MATHIPPPSAQTFDVETHLQTARSMVRAIMMSAGEITNDQRDNLMLTNLTIAIDNEFDAIDKIMGIASGGAES